jgi:hypothetical protein
MYFLTLARDTLTIFIAHLNILYVLAGRQKWYRLKLYVAAGRGRLSIASDWLTVASGYISSRSGRRSSPEMNGVPSPRFTRHTLLFARTQPKAYCVVGKRQRDFVNNSDMFLNIRTWKKSAGDTTTASKMYERPAAVTQRLTPRWTSKTGSLPSAS